MLLAISPPPDNARGPHFMEQVLNSFHAAARGREATELHYGCHGKTVQLYCRFPDELAPQLTDSLAAQYPTCTLTRLPDNVLTPAPDAAVWSATLSLRPELFPLLSRQDFEDLLTRDLTDPVTNLLTTVRPRDDVRTDIAIILRPATAWRSWWAMRDARRLRRPFFHTYPSTAFAIAVGMSSPWPVRWLTRLASMLVASKRDGRSVDPLSYLDAARDKARQTNFVAQIVVSVNGPTLTRQQARLRLRQTAAAFSPFSRPDFSQFRLGRIPRSAPRTRGRGALLLSQEAALLAHPATHTVRSPQMDTNRCRELEPPAFLPDVSRERSLAVLGRVQHHSSKAVFGLRSDDRARHLSIVGKTGMGKTTLLYNLILSDIVAGHGVAVFDPHGDLADDLLKAIPKHRTNDLVNFDVGDRAHPVAFNVLQCGDPNLRPHIASGIVAAFKKLYGDSWGPRLEYLLRNSSLALQEQPGATLLSIQRLLTDASYRKQVASRIGDPLLCAFWQREFGGWSDRYRTEAIAPVLNKIGQFAMHPVLRNILGQPRSSIDLRRIMDRGQILIANLSKGKATADGSSLLGSMLIAYVELAAMSRANVAASARRPFYLYADEFQNFATDSFATILSEARKYGLHLTLAHQYLGQLALDKSATTLRDSIFGNVGSLVCFQVGADDAEQLAVQLDEELLAPRDLRNLPKYRAYVRLLIDGQPSPPFSMHTLPPTNVSANRGRRRVVRKQSRIRYAPRTAEQVGREIEAAIGPP